jgi:glycosyl transferase, family 25
MELFNFFERVYIVNLPARMDRRQEMEAELKRFGLRVDGEKIRFFRAIRPETAGDFPSLGARGCYMSHLSILREAHQEGLENILVLEDDLELGQQLSTPLPEMLSRLKQSDWSFAYFGHAIDLDSHSAPPYWVTYKEGVGLTHFYALSKRVIPELLDYLESCLGRPVGDPEGGPMHVDGAYTLFRGRRTELITLLASPSLGRQRSSRSDVSKTKWFERTAVLQFMTDLGRRMKNRLRKR